MFFMLFVIFFGVFQIFQYKITLKILIEKDKMHEAHMNRAWKWGSQDWANSGKMNEFSLWSKNNNDESVHERKLHRPVHTHPHTHNKIKNWWNLKRVHNLVYYIVPPQFPGFDNVLWSCKMSWLSGARWRVHRNSLYYFFNFSWT